MYIEKNFKYKNNFGYVNQFFDINVCGIFFGKVKFIYPDRIKYLLIIRFLRSVGVT
jgi:hypothetical protein